MIFTVIYNTVVADNIINSDSMKEDKLIEREVLFGNPEKAGVKISHDAYTRDFTVNGLFSNNYNSRSKIYIEILRKI